MAGIFPWIATGGGLLLDWLQFNDAQRQRNQDINRAVALAGPTGDLYAQLPGLTNNILDQELTPSNEYQSQLSNLSAQIGGMQGTDIGFNPIDFGDYTYDGSGMRELGSRISGNLTGLGDLGLGEAQNSAMAALAGANPSDLVSKAQGIFDSRVDTNRWLETQRAAGLANIGGSSAEALKQANQSAISNSLRGGGGLEEAQGQIGANEFDLSRSNAGSIANMEAGLQGAKLGADTQIANTLAGLTGQQESLELQKAIQAAGLMSSMGIASADTRRALAEAGASAELGAATTAEGLTANNLAQLLSARGTEEGQRIQLGLGNQAQNLAEYQLLADLIDRGRNDERFRAEQRIQAEQLGIGGQAGVNQQLMALYGNLPYDTFSFSNPIAEFFKNR